MAFRFCTTSTETTPSSVTLDYECTFKGTLDKHPFMYVYTDKYIQT